MTGKEKIQYIIDMVRLRYDELVFGNVVTLNSDMFTRQFISIAELVHVLDMMVEQKQIKYKARNLFEPDEINAPETQRDIIEISSLNGSITPQQIEEGMFMALEFRIEVLNLPELEAVGIDHAEQEPEAVPLKSRYIEIHKLEPEHYNKKSGVLTLSPTNKVKIAKRGSATRKSNGKKYAQCWLLECVFKSVKTMNEGVHIAKILDVSRPKIGNNEIKKVTNIVQEINEKITDVNGPDNLIKLQNKHVFVNNSYL